MTLHQAPNMANHQTNNKSSKEGEITRQSKQLRVHFPTGIYYKYTTPAIKVKENNHFISIRMHARRKPSRLRNKTQVTKR